MWTFSSWTPNEFLERLVLPIKLLMKKTLRSSTVCLSELQLLLYETELVRCGSRAALTSKMEPFLIIVNGFQPLIIITKHSSLDVAAALDPPLLVLNWRPLGFVYDNHFEQILTPDHLLFVLKLITCNSSIQYNAEINSVLLKHVHHINMFFFRSRWRNEYATSLREYDKKYKRTSYVKPLINEWYSSTISKKTAPKQMDAWMSSRTYKWR